jgi:hypothetical protein
LFLEEREMVDRSAKRRKTTDQRLGTPGDLGLQCHEGYHCGIECAPGRRFHALQKEHEHPLACQRAAFPQLSSAVRGARDRNHCHDGRSRTGAQSRRSALRLVGDIACHQPLDESNPPYIDSRSRLAEPCEDTSASLHQRTNPKVPAIDTRG